MNTFHKTIFWHNILIAVVLVVLFMPHLASAQTGFIEETLWKVVNSVFGFFAWMGGQLLNYAITHYVVGFGDQFNVGSGTGNTVNILWSLVRDIFNLTFIFGLVYIGLKLILNSGDSRARSMLVSLILAALLVNFSLFITKFVIDFTNIAAFQIVRSFELVDGTYRVSNAFMNVLGFNELFSPGASLQRIAEGSAGYTYIFSTMFLYIILAFVFMAGGILLMIRYIVLVIYMILSPIMFLGWVFPGFASTSQDYWRKFLSRAFFAPAYILMLYFANQVMVSMQIANGISRESFGRTFSGQTEVGNDFSAVIPFFLMTAAFLIASLVVAQKMGAEGSNMAISAGQGLRRFTQRRVGGATFGAAGALGRNTIGRAANKAANLKGFNNFAARNSFGAATLKATRGVADSSFDARRVGGVGKKIGIGEGAKGGYSSNLKAKQKADLEFAKSLKENDLTRGVDGKIINDKDGELQKKIDADIEAQKLDEKTAYGKANKAREAASKAKEAAATAAKESLDKAEASRKEIERLKKESAATDPKGTGKSRVAALNEKIRLEEANLKNIEAENQTAKAALVEAEAIAKQTKAADERAAKAAKDSAESKLVYANQLEFIARREKEAARWSSAKGLAGSAVAGAAAGAAAGAFIGPAGMVIGATVGAFAGPAAAFRQSGRAKAGAEELRKQYGTDGTVKKKSSQEEKTLKILSEKMKEAGVDPKPEVADEEK